MTRTRHKRPAFAAMHGPDLLYLAGDPWPWGTPHETARVHHAARRRGGRMAACGARAAIREDVPDRLSRRVLATRSTSRKLTPCEGPSPARIRGGQEHCHRVSVGRGQIRPPPRTRSRAGEAQRRCARNHMVRPAHGGQASHLDHSDRVGRCRRSRRGRARGQPRPSRRESDRLDLFLRRNLRQAGRVDQGGHSDADPARRFGQSCQSLAHAHSSCGHAAHCQRVGRGTCAHRGERRDDIAAAIATVATRRAAALVAIEEPADYFQRQTDCGLRACRTDCR